MTRALLVALAFTSGCLDLVEPDVGPLGQAACVDADSDPGVAVSYQRDVVGAIFSSEAYQCVRCHTAAGETPLGLVVGGLDLGSYDGLRRGGVQAGADVVVPGRPCASASSSAATDGMISPCQRSVTYTRYRLQYGE